MKLGVHEKLPSALLALTVKTLPVVAGEEAAVSELIASPSGSFTVTLKLMFVFSFPDAVAGAVTAGARSTLVTVTWVDDEAESVFVAVNVTVYVPALLKLGVHAQVPDVREALTENVLPVVAGELAAVNDVNVWPSGSLAVTVKVISVFSAPEAVAGAVTTGAPSKGATEIFVTAEPESVFVAVNVTL